jgi:hypothetical protein
MSSDNCSHSEPSRYALTRVLVELGKKNLSSVLPLLEQAILSDDCTLCWTALHELVELGNTYPQQVVSLLEHIMDHKSSSQISKESRVLIGPGEQHLDQLIPVFKDIMKGDDVDRQWLSILELIEIAPIEPDRVIPLFEEALHSNNEHIRWMVTLELFELAKHHPTQVTPILSKILNGELSVIPSSKKGRKKFTELAATLDDLKSLEKDLLSNDTNTQWVAAVKLITLAREHPQEVTPLLTRIMENNPTDVSCRITHIFSELDKKNSSHACSMTEDHEHHHDQSKQSEVLHELFELLHSHIQNLSTLLNTELPKAKSTKANKKAVETELHDVQQITQLIEKLVEQNHPDLQWTTLHKLLKLKLFTPEKLIVLIGKVIQNRVHTHDPNIHATRVLVELGQKFPELAEPAFKHALNVSEPELHWAAMQELQTLIKISPKIASYFDTLITEDD